MAEEGAHAGNQQAKIGFEDNDLTRLARRAARFASRGEKVPQSLLDEIARIRARRDEMRGRS